MDEPARLQTAAEAAEHDADAHLHAAALLDGIADDLPDSLDAVASLLSDGWVGTRADRARGWWDGQAAELQRLPARVAGISDELRAEARRQRVRAAALRGMAGEVA